MLVSIIIPVYNVEDYLERCLDSVIKQTYKNIEIIVVNDGSTDNSYEIMNSFKDSRLRIITKPNGGLSSARNEGLKYATGDYVTFIDSDDWVSNMMIESMVEKATKYDADIVCVDEKVTDGSFIVDHSKEDYHMFYGDDCLSQLLSMRVKSYTWGKLYRHSIFSYPECHFPEGQNYEDVATSYKFFFHCQTLVTVHKQFYYYYQRPNSIVKTKRLVESVSMLKYLLEMQSYNIQNPFWEYYQLKILYGCLIYSFRLPKEEKESLRYNETIIALIELKNKIHLRKPLMWYISQNDFYKIFLLKTNLYRLALIKNKLGIK